MVEEKNVKSEKWKEKFADAFAEAMKQTEFIGRKIQMAHEVIDKYEAKDQIQANMKAMVAYEFTMRLAMERQKVYDTLFATVSPVLDRKDAKGMPMACPVCLGKDDSFKCRECGGVRRVVDYDWSLRCRTLFVMNDLNHLLSQSLPQQQDDMILKAFEGIRMQAKAFGMQDADVEDALKQMAPMVAGQKMTDQQLAEFIAAYKDYAKKKDEEEGHVAGATAEKAAPAGQ